MAEKIREFVNICGKSASKWTRMDLNFARHTRPAIYENFYRKWAKCDWSSTCSYLPSVDRNSQTVIVKHINTGTFPWQFYCFIVTDK